MTSGVKTMFRRLNPIFCLFLLLASLAAPALSQSPLLKSSGSETDRDRDGLNGPVRRIKTETAKLATRAGKVVEADKKLLEAVAYDLKGNKTENAYYPISTATLTGKEVYKYDDKGNISEMTLLNADGSLLSKEVYNYEFDFVGNWTKMTTSVAVVENGKLSFEPTEVTYRSISYYLDEATLAKMMQQQQQPAPASAQPAPANAAVNNAAANHASASNVPANNVATKSEPQPTGNNNNAPGKAATPSSAATGQPQVVKTSAPASPQPSGPAASDKPVSTAAQNNSQTSAQPNGSAAAPNNNNAAANNNNSVSEQEAKAAAEASLKANNSGPKPLMKPISGGVLNGSAISLPKPNYPEAAKNVRAAGVVTVEVIIDVSGKVISAKATSGHPLLQQSAVQAAYQAKFSPTTLSGQPVRVSGTINYNFSLAK
jgi:protein TonB